VQNAGVGWRPKKETHERSRPPAAGGRSTFLIIKDPCVRGPCHGKELGSVAFQAPLGGGMSLFGRSFFFFVRSPRLTLPCRLQRLFKGRPNTVDLFARRWGSEPVRRARTKNRKGARFFYSETAKGAETRLVEEKISDKTKHTGSVLDSGRLRLIF